MTLNVMIGKTVDADLIIDPRDSRTKDFSAGGLTFGVEFREFNGAIIDDNFGDDPEKLTAMEVARQFDVEGVAVHVHDSSSKDEYLRFDGFVDVPHYHYIYPRSHHTIVYWDENAQGDFLEYLPTLLRDRLAAMLAEVVPASLLARYDFDKLGAILPDVLAEVDRLKVRLHG